MYLNAGLTALAIATGYAYYSVVESKKNEEITIKGCESQKFERDLCLRSNGPLANCDDASFALKICLEGKKSS